MSSDSRSISPVFIGEIPLANRVVLAPMSGVTDTPFRRLVAKLGAGLVVSEMTASRDLAQGRPGALLRAEGRGVAIHVVQIAGCESRWMAEGARIAESAGADIIDINMGCPARQVTGGQSGSALMRDLNHALALIEATVAAVAIPVTLKMRLGWDERSINAPELARRAEQAGVRMITVHGRTRCQFYKGQADWSAIRAVKDQVSVPLVVNGDIRSFADSKAALNASGADLVMVGRAALGRPWLPGTIARYLETGQSDEAPTLESQLGLLILLYEEILTHYGVEIGRRHARKHLAAGLDAAGQTAGVIDGLRADSRHRALTAESPAATMHGLREAFAMLADAASRSRTARSLAA